MNLGLICPDVPGHLNPSLSLASALTQRGHRVRIIATPGARPEVEHRGLELIPIGQPEHDDGDFDRAKQDLGHRTGLSGVILTSRLIAQHGAILRRDLTTLLQRDPVDALLVDQVCPGGADVAQRLDLPFTVLCNALCVILDPQVPPVTTPWTNGSSWWARLRNGALAYAAPIATRMVSGSILSQLNPLALCHGVGEAHAVLTQQPPHFCLPRERQWPGIHHTNPWHTPDQRSHVPFPFERLDNRPLIYASLGTLQNRNPQLFELISATAEKNPNYQFVMSLGRNEARWTAPLPPNVIVVPFAPQLELLSRAHLAITHAGLNTALECLAAGVPMLCLPITNDQPGVAARVTTCQAGLQIAPHRVTPQRLHNLINELLNNPIYRTRTQAFKTDIAKKPGPEQAAEIIESVLSP